MAKRLPNPPPGFDELTFDQKVAYIESLWNRVAANPDTVPVPQWHLDLIEERLRTSQGHGRPWSKVRDELRARLQDRNRSR
jgi:hypothetical protein